MLPGHITAQGSLSPHAGPPATAWFVRLVGFSRLRCGVGHGLQFGLRAGHGEGSEGYAHVVEGVEAFPGCHLPLLDVVAEDHVFGFEPPDAVVCVA